MMAASAQKSRPKKSDVTTLVSVRLDEEAMAALAKLEAVVDPDVSQPRPVAIRRAIKLAAELLGREQRRK